MNQSSYSAGRDGTKSVFVFHGPELKGVARVPDSTVAIIRQDFPWDESAMVKAPGRRPMKPRVRRNWREGLSWLILETAGNVLCQKGPSHKACWC